MSAKQTNITLWHCDQARSLRPLWALEEMQLDYNLELLPFPPRFFQKEYLGTNVLGTVPYLVDGETRMTESSGMCHYLAERYAPEFALRVDHAEYGDFINWLYQSDATLTFPQALYLRYSMMEPPERRQPQVAEDYKKWYLARLRWLDEHLAAAEGETDGRSYLCDNRFTIADIAITYALYLGELNGFAELYSAQVFDYLQRMKQRAAFQKSVDLTKNSDLQTFR